MNIYIYIYICLASFGKSPRSTRSRQDRLSRAPTSLPPTQEFTKGGLVKGGLAIYVFPLCNCNTLGSVFNVQIENMPNC